MNVINRQQDKTKGSVFLSTAKQSLVNKVGPQRTSKNTGRLQLLPEEGSTPSSKDGTTRTGKDKFGSIEIYSQFSQISDEIARKDAERLNKSLRAQLPRVTAYCTAGSYDLQALYKFFESHYTSNDAEPELLDDCIYSVYNYHSSSSFMKYYPEMRRNESLIKFSDSSVSQSPHTDFDNPAQAEDKEFFPDITNHIPANAEVFCFEYGVVVFWGFFKEDEERFLQELRNFELERISHSELEVEEFNYYVTNSYQPRIWNDFISLKDGNNSLIKLAISHAIAQSVKISYFEGLVDDTIEATKDIPSTIAITGTIPMSRKEISMSVGELLILRTNINLQSSVLDKPELMWDRPQLEPTYQAARSYLEINSRVALLNQRLEVITDLMTMLREQVNHSHDEYLEWIVIILIAIEILIACVNLLVDMKSTGE